MKNKLLTTYVIITLGIFLMGASTWKTDLVNVLQDLRDALAGNPDIGGQKYKFYVALDGANYSGEANVYKFNSVTGDTWVRKNDKDTEYTNSFWSYIPTK